jgi:cell division protein FtsW (lipid II flippase)
MKKVFIEWLKTMKFSQFLRALIILIAAIASLTECKERILPDSVLLSFVVVTLVLFIVGLILRLCFREPYKKKMTRLLVSQVIALALGFALLFGSENKTDQWLYVGIFTFVYLIRRLLYDSFCYYVERPLTNALNPTKRMHG